MPDCTHASQVKWQTLMKFVKVDRFFGQRANMLDFQHIHPIVRTPNLVQLADYRKKHFLELYPPLTRGRLFATTRGTYPLQPPVFSPLLLK